MPRFAVRVAPIPLPLPEPKKEPFNELNGLSFLPKIRSYDSLDFGSPAAASTNPTTANKFCEDTKPFTVVPSLSTSTAVGTRPGTDGSAASSWDVSSDEERQEHDEHRRTREKMPQTTSALSPCSVDEPVLDSGSIPPAPRLGPKTPPPLPIETPYVAKDRPLPAEVKPGFSLLSSRLNDSSILEAGTNPPPPESPAAGSGSDMDLERSPTPPPAPYIGQPAKYEKLPLSAILAAQMSDVSDDEGCSAEERTASDHEEGQILTDPESGDNQSTRCDLPFGLDRQRKRSDER